MTALINNALLAMEISQTTLIVLMAVLIVLIILLAVLATIFILGVRRKNEEPQLNAVTVVADFDNTLGIINLKDENNIEKNLFISGETVRVFVKANEGYRLSNISVEVNENVLARFTADNRERNFSEGMYEFVITANSTIKAEFEAIIEPIQEIISFAEHYCSEGGKLIFSDVYGIERNEFVKGETVRISTVADEGYYLARFAINDEEKELIEGVYEFVVHEPVSINVEFMPVPVEKFDVVLGAVENGSVKVMNTDGEEQIIFADGESAKIVVSANEGYCLSRLVINGEEKELSESYQLVVNSNVSVEAEFSALPEKEVAAEVEEDDEDEVIFDGHNVIRFNKSFTAKLIQTDEVSNSWYTELKNELLSYNKVKDRMSWKRESYRLGKICVARFVIRGKTLCIQLPLDPLQYEDTKYKVEDISHIVSSADTPCLYRIKNERRLNYAKDLIAQVMENMGAVRKEREWVDYNQPYDTTANLIERQLVKKIIKFNGKTGYGGIVEKVSEDPNKDKQ